MQRMPYRATQNRTETFIFGTSQQKELETGDAKTFQGIILSLTLIFRFFFLLELLTVKC